LGRTINAVSVSGTKVQLTLAAPVVYGDVVTVSYTKPSVNPLQASSGGQAASISGKPVTNNCSSPIPVYSSSVVENASPTLLAITYSIGLANIIPLNSAFSVLVNSVATTVSSVSISGTKVQLTLASAIKFGDIVTVSYTKPATNPLQSVSGGQAVNILGRTVTNNLINPVKDVTPITITMTISPNHVHKIINVLLVYSSTPTAVLAPEILRIADISGKLFIEKALVTGATTLRIPINLRSGIYMVTMLAGGLEMASQKMIVY
jgi:uncharacterized repeat protein (TIGR02059 family)